MPSGVKHARLFQMAFRTFLKFFMQIACKFKIFYLLLLMSTRRERVNEPTKLLNRQLQIAQEATQKEGLRNVFINRN